MSEPTEASAPAAPPSAEGPSATAQQINPEITPVDDNPDDSDSAYGESDHLSDTTSIPSTIWKHRYENGRRYHKFREGEHWAPNDDTHNDMLDIGHHMFLIMLNHKLHLAPIKEPKKIIDLGCGTGIWCIDMADEHPNAEVLGVDLSPTQPSFVPPNLKFEIDDVTSPWVYPKNHFDFINIRGLYGSIGDWRALYRQIWDHLEPGGYLHHVETSIQGKSDDGTLKPDNPMSQWSDVFHEASEKFGKPFKEVWSLPGYIRDQGFEVVTEQVYKIPINGWPADPHMKELGKWNFLHCTQGAEGWGLFLLTKVLGWTVEEAQILIAKFREAIKDRRVHCYFEAILVVARKPVSTI